MGTKHAGTADERRALEAYIALMRAANSVAARLAKDRAFGDLTTSQFGVLEALLHLGPLSQRQLADKLLKSTGNLVTVIDNLVKRDLVRRERSKTDRRVVHVVLTPTGRASIEALFPKHVNAVVRSFSILGQADQLELKRLCRLLGIRQAALGIGP